jgi:hypothetical protein
MDTTEDKAKSQEGGVEWEARQALASAENALIAAGIDPEAYMTAARRHTEAVRNMMLVELVPSFEKALQGIIDKSGASALAEGVAEVKALLKTQAQNQRAIESDIQSRATYFYKHFNAFLKDADARFNGYDQSIATAVEAVAVAGKALARADEAVAGVADLAGKVSNQGEQIDTLANRVALIEQTPGTYPDLLRGMQRLEKMVLTNGKKSDERQEMNDRRQTYLLIGLGLIVLLLVVASLVSLGG